MLARDPRYHSKETPSQQARPDERARVLRGVRDPAPERRLVTPRWTCWGFRDRSQPQPRALVTNQKSRVPIESRGFVAVVVGSNLGGVAVAEHVGIADAPER